MLHFHLLHRNLPRKFYALFALLLVFSIACFWAAFYLSSRHQHDAALIDLATRNGSLSQQITNIATRLADNPADPAPREELRQALVQQEQVLYVLRNGGKMQTGDAVLPPAHSRVLPKLLELDEYFLVRKRLVSRLLDLSARTTPPAAALDSLGQQTATTTPPAVAGSPLLRTLRELTDPFLQQTQLGLDNELKQLYVQQTEQTQATYRHTLLVLLLLNMAVITLIFGHIRRTLRPLTALSNYARLLAQGQIPPPITATYPDEIGQTIRSLGHLSEQLRQAATFAGQIGQGELQESEKTALGEGPLAQALLGMRDNLRRLSLEESQRRWSAEGLAQFSELLRVSGNNRNDLSDRLLQFLVRYLGANQGALFIRQSASGSDYLDLAACYAYDRKKFIGRRIGPGEGLVGQVWQEADTIYLTDLPEEYIHISSGLGEARPKCLLLVPLQLNEQVFGVLELASFHSFEPHQIALVEKLSETLASSLASWQMNERTQALLRESQLQTEHMRSQEEEMRQNLEELEATQEEMRRKEQTHLGEIERLSQLHEQTLLEAQQQAQAFETLSLVANNTDNSVIITDAQGFIEYVNPGFTRLTGYSLEEVRGRKPGSFLQGANTDPQTVARLRRHLQQGEACYEEILNYDKAGNSYWISLAINPVMNPEGRVTRYISIQANVTETKRRSLDYNSQLQAIGRSNAIVEFDLEGNVLTANNNFLDLMGYSLDEVQGKHHRMFVLPKERESEEYLNLWQRLREGKFTAGEFVRQTRSGQLVYLKGNYNAILDITGQPYKIIKFAQDITEQRKLQEALTQASLLNAGQVAAINSTLATVEFDPEGRILTANDNFLALVKYRLSEIVGKPHRLLLDAEYARSAAYQKFWDDLLSGKAQVGEVRRQTKQGEGLWLSASYTPVLDEAGKVFKIIKFAQDITERKNTALDHQSQLVAISKSNATIEFDLEGKILTANENFLALMRYGLEEIKGRHHRLFVPEHDRESAEYQSFWHRLRQGEFVSGEFKRVTKGGQTVWIKGSYNAIQDLSGKPYKVVKYAFDITEQKRLEMEALQQAEELRAQEEELRQNMEELQATQEEAERKSLELEAQISAINTTMATVEFDLEGKILMANDNFLSVTGYTLDEILQRPHRIFLKAEQAQSGDYAQFWRDLGEGKARTGRFERVTKAGNPVILQASYTPVFNRHGKVVKVIKLAQLVEA